jgi:periplasmic protein TonB
VSRWLAPVLLALAAHAAVAAIPVPEPEVTEPRPLRLALRAAPAADPPSRAEPAIEPHDRSSAAAAPAIEPDERSSAAAIEPDQRRSAAAPPPAPAHQSAPAAATGTPRPPATGDEPAVRIEADAPTSADRPATRPHAASTSALAQLGEDAPPPAPAARADDGALDAYAAGVRRAVEAHKRYPRRARSLGHEGTVMITVAIAADGTLAGAPAVTAPSSSPLLDAEAERMARAAAPFPPPPGDRAPLRVAVPIVFALD